MKPQWRQRRDFTLKLLWLPSTKPPNFKKIRLAEFLQIDFKIDLMFYT